MNVVRHKYEDAMLTLMHMLDHHREAQVVVLEYFVQTYGPISEDAAAEVREMLKIPSAGDTRKLIHHPIEPHICDPDHPSTSEGDDHCS